MDCELFSGKGLGRGVRSLGAIVVEVTDQKVLRESLQVLSQELFRTKAKERHRIAHELHASIVQYQAALKTSLRCLVRPIWQTQDRGAAGTGRHVAGAFPGCSTQRRDHRRNIFQHLEQNPKAWSGFFARIAGDPELQREMLQVLSQHPEAQNDIIIIIRMARSLKFRAWLLKIVPNNSDQSARCLSYCRSSIATYHARWTPP